MAAEPAMADELVRELRISPPVARVLAARGFATPEAAYAFLHPDLISGTHAPERLRDMDRAVERIAAAIAGGERIRICGDYDADGITAVAILRQALASLGARVDYRLPHRMADGYGLGAEAVEAARAEEVRLLVTVDTGIREFAGLERARALGLDAIVTDHHQPGAVLPPALAVIDPGRSDCSYPNKHLTGAGLAFKLAQALLERHGRVAAGQWPPLLQSYLRLVAIGLIADAAPLVGENRVLTSCGLAEMAGTRNPGLRALLALALPGHAGARVRARDVAFRIAPRLNAAGRMDHADCAVELFFASPAEAGQLAQRLEELNVRRRQACDELVGRLEAGLAAAGASPVALFAGAGWHRGVLGIAATRLMRRTGRAVLVASIEDGGAGEPLAHGSGRAPAGFPLLELFEGCRDLFASGAPGGGTARFGGHAQALGFVLPAAHLEELGRRLQRAAAAIESSMAPQPAPPADAALAFSEIDAQFLADLERMQPFGEGNREPCFAARPVRLAAPPQVLRQAHCKLALEQHGRRFDALFWNAFPASGQTPLPANLKTGAWLEAAFRIQADTHPRFGDRVQLVLENLRPQLPA